jgi:hypothetical protein
MIDDVILFGLILGVAVGIAITWPWYNDKGD